MSRRGGKSAAFSIWRAKAAAWIAPALPAAACFFSLALSFSFVTPVFARPMLVLIPIYYFSMVKSADIGFISIMLFGFVQDFVDGTAFGLNIFLFLSLYFIIYYQKIFPIAESNAFAFLVFAAISGALVLIKASIISIFFLPKGAIAASAAANWVWLLIFYPPLAWLLSKAERAVERDSVGT
jgi:cell shape-determining protein MreD